MKVSEVEAEFHRRISEVPEEFRGRISDLQAEFCRVNSATEEVAVAAVSLPSNETKGQEEWRVVSGPQGDTASGNGKFLRCVGGCGGGERGGEKRGDHCRRNGWAFIDNWDLFYGKDTLYARDGVHLSREGVRILTGTLEGE
ncbi:hypothetical protein E2C01_100445 [Portunus trituberculatus]|uniref:Uncharacterized protein n=1 Tax=Portunus trituberculatus TaxID=210409 RepID=A0A5B7KC87_PORTR|nr:hypothetical protein [Portunus trituberculatus]